MVLLIEDNVPPLQWPMGRVVSVHPGPDGNVRVVTVQTTSGTYKRNVRKVCPLSLEHEGTEEPEEEPEVNQSV